MSTPVSTPVSTPARTPESILASTPYFEYPSEHVSLRYIEAKLDIVETALTLGLALLTLCGLAFSISS